MDDYLPFCAVYKRILRFLFHKIKWKIKFYFIWVLKRILVTQGLAKQKINKQKNRQRHFYWWKNFQRHYYRWENCLLLVYASISEFYGRKMEKAFFEYFYGFSCLFASPHVISAFFHTLDIRIIKIILLCMEES